MIIMLVKPQKTKTGHGEKGKKKIGNMWGGGVTPMDDHKEKQKKEGRKEIEGSNQDVDKPIQDCLQGYEEEK